MQSQNLKDFGLIIIDSKIMRLIIDLSECATMDSTFLGVLAMVALKMNVRKKTVEIVNADRIRKELLTNLGLRKLFVFTHTKTDQVDWLSLNDTKADNESDNDALKKAEIMLESHETLMEVSPLNIPKFKDIVEFLKKDIKNLSS